MQIYDSDFINQINNGVDLLDYVSESIPMERKGHDYFGHCPLHVDETPSFSITPSKNAYYCFSCGRYGRIINFLMQYEHLPFHNAVAKGAALAKINMDTICKSETISRLKRMRILLQKKPPVVHEAIDEKLYKQYTNTPSKEWIDEGIPEDVQRIFGIRIDHWQNRIVYPVYDIDGRLINVKGRTRYPNYKQMKIAKYINYFRVGTMDYFQGLNITLPYVKESGEIIIFESIKSVMKMYAWGYKNCASAEKHTITDEQISLLVRLRCNIVFAFDSDISYSQNDIVDSLNKLKRMTNVYVIEDKENLLGGKEAKNSPADLSKEVWDKLYESKRKLI